MTEKIDRRLDEEIHKELDQLWKSIEEGHTKFREEMEKIFQDMDKELKAASEGLEGLGLNLGKGQKVEAQKSRQKAGGLSQKSRKRHP